VAQAHRHADLVEPDPVARGVEQTGDVVDFAALAPSQLRGDVDLAPKRRRPRPDPDDGLFEWADVGGQQIWVVGYTPGGMPFGLTEEEYYASCDDDRPF
jgi:hypothetical protein